MGRCWQKQQQNHAAKEMAGVKGHEPVASSPVKNGWGSWACLAWRREGSRGILLGYSSTWRELINRRGPDFFTWADSDKTRGNSFKLTQGRFRLGVRGKFFTLRAMRHWHSCPEKQWMPHPLRCLRPGWVEPWATSSSGWQPCRWLWGCNQIGFEVSSYLNSSSKISCNMEESM